MKSETCRKQHFRSDLRFLNRPSTLLHQQSEQYRNPPRQIKSFYKKNTQNQAIKGLCSLDTNRGNLIEDQIFIT